MCLNASQLNGLTKTEQAKILRAVVPWLGALLTSATVAGAALPDSPFSVESWDNSQGSLPDNEVLAMTRTHDGYLWLGTLHGLVRFDGVHFTVFDASNTKLKSIQILHLFEDSRRNLWVGFGGQSTGAALITGGEVQNIDFGGGGRNERLVSACEDVTGAVWLLTKNGKLGRCINQSLTDVWNMNPFSATSFSASSVIQEAGGLVWIGSDTQFMGVDPKAPRTVGLPVVVGPETMRVDLLLASRAGGYWRLAQGRIRKYSGTNLVEDFGAYPWGINSNPLLCACEDREGNLVVGTGGPSGQGVFWFDSKGNATQVSSQDGLPNNSVYSMESDGDGNLWVGLDGGGLNRVKRRVFKLMSASYGSVVQSLCPDGSGGVWLSAKFRDFSDFSHGMLRAVDSSPGPMRQFNPTAILVDHEKEVWGATYGAGLFRLDGDVFRSALAIPQDQGEISVLFQDHTGTLWAGTTEGLARWRQNYWQIFTITNGLSANIVHAVAEDHAGNLWIGTEPGGLDRMREGQFTVFCQTNGFPADTISALYADEDDTLWVGTEGNGLIRLRDGKWSHYTTVNGLVGNSIDYLIEDGEGYLWIGSNAGLMRVRKSDLNEAASFITCRSYDQRDGLPANECSFGAQPAACRLADGSLWFPTVAGAVTVNPRDIHLNTNPPPVVIESVLVEGKRQETNGLLAAPSPFVTVPAGEEDLEIHYTSLNLGGAEQARFRYRLQGHEIKWRDAGNLRVARYLNLTPGDYHFQVQACNEDGFWNETGASLAVTVMPFFWQTWWFCSALGAVLLCGVVGVVHFISTQKLSRELAAARQQQALDTERARIARDIHDQVGASLTQLALLGEMVESDKDCPDEAETHARQISQTARETTRALDEIVWTVNPSNDSLDGLVNYICKHAQEYLAVAGLRYRLDVPAHLPPAVISPETRHNVFLAAKESVTNIVKHARASEAWIRLQLAAPGFIIEIEDNGRGPGGAREKAAESRNGLRNMRKRMEDIGGGFSISPGAQGGTLVRLTVPLTISPTPPHAH